MSNTQELFKQIAEALGNEWECQPPDEDWDWASLKNSNGWEITLTGSHNGASIEVSGVYPRSVDRNWVLYSGETAKKINVSATRSPRAIAKDIQRRFIPNYEAVYNLCIDRIAIAKANDEKVAANVAALAQVLGEKHRRGNNTIRWSNGYANSPYYWADFVVNADSVSIKLSSLPLDKALAIAKTLAD